MKDIYDTLYLDNIPFNYWTRRDTCDTSSQNHQKSTMIVWKLKYM